MESPSRRGWQVAQVDRTAQAVVERRVGRSRMPHAGYTNSITNDGPRPCTDISGKELPEPITRAIEVTLPTPISTLPMHDHSFIHSHACIHTFIHTFIHSSIHPFIHPIHPSIAYAIAASQRFASRHEAVVVSFDMSGDRLRFEGRPMESSRPPRVKQS